MLFQRTEKRMVRWLAGAVVVLPLLIGGAVPCPEPNYPDITKGPFPVDPNMVQGQLLDWIRLEVGQRWVHTRTWCDPEGDPARAEIVSAPEGVQIVNKPKISSYTLLWTPAEPMLAAIVVRVTDMPLRGQPTSNTGTILVHVVAPEQRPASGGCASQPQKKPSQPQEKTSKPQKPAPPQKRSQPPSTWTWGQ
jgi:hypothetical protein